jgi:hypothetical protein
VEGGKIKEFSCNVDRSSMLAQLGVNPDFASRSKRRRPRDRASAIHRCARESALRLGARGEAADRVHGELTGQGPRQAGRIPDTARLRVGLDVMGA